MPTQEKFNRVEELKEQLERSTITFGADYTRTTVNQMVELRRAMRANGLEFTVVKNTLMYLAAEQAGKPQVKEIVQGPTAVAFGYDDPAAAAKALADYARANANSFSIRGAVLGDSPPMGPEGVTRLATLPPQAATGSNFAGPDAGSHVPVGRGAQRPGAESGQRAARPDAPTGRRIILHQHPKC